MTVMTVDKETKIKEKALKAEGYNLSGLYRRWIRENYPRLMQVATKETKHERSA
jgi:hypothetical protein